MNAEANARTAHLVDQLRVALHDLNNALTPVMANAQLARFMLDSPSGELKETLDDVVEASGRANALVLDMRQIAQSLHDALPTGDADERSPEEKSRG